MPDGTIPETNNSNTTASPILNDFYDWVEAIVFSLAFVILLFTFAFRPVGVGGVSMKNTLNKENWVVNENQYLDRVLINNINYHPKAGDIIVFSTPAVTKPLIKRVIAVGGQTVNIDYQQHTVAVDGKILKESYISCPTTLQGDVRFPITVPAGHVFVMGDNRNNSYDSRFRAIGMIDQKVILGKAFLRIFPFDQIGPLH